MNALIDAVAQVEDEAQGVLDVRIVRPADKQSIILGALAGDPQATRLMRAVSTATLRIQRAPKRTPALCGCCPRRLKKGYAVVAVFPNRGDPSAAIAFAICPNCGTELPDIRAKAAIALQKIWPQSRFLPPEHCHPEGSA